MQEIKEALNIQNELLRLYRIQLNKIQPEPVDATIKLNYVYALYKNAITSLEEKATDSGDADMINFLCGDKEYFILRGKKITRDMLNTMRFSSTVHAQKCAECGKEKWISVEERLPKDGEIVLVTGFEYNRKNGKRFKQVSLYNKGFRHYIESSESWSGDSSNYITDWQPLPPDPVKEKQGE